MVDQPDDRDLDYAFELPDTVEDQRLRALYEVLVHRMRDEARHLTMNTVQQLLIERIAYHYIVLRCKERGEQGGFGNTSAQKDYNSFWLSMTAEFNRMLGRSDNVSGADRKAFIKEIQNIIVKTVSKVVADPRTRSGLLESMATELEKVGA